MDRQVEAPTFAPGDRWRMKKPEWSWWKGIIIRQHHPCIHTRLGICKTCYVVKSFGDDGSLTQEWYLSDPEESCLKAVGV